MPTENDLLLRQCENIIKEGLKNLYKIERALSIIKEMQLYQEDFNNFEEYCRQKWEIDKSLDFLERECYSKTNHKE